MSTYTCNLCNYSSIIKQSFDAHCKTKKHLANLEEHKKNGDNKTVPIQETPTPAPTSAPKHVSKQQTPTKATPAQVPKPVPKQQPTAVATERNNTRQEDISTFYEDVRRKFHSLDAEIRNLKEQNQILNARYNNLMELVNTDEYRNKKITNFNVITLPAHDTPTDYFNLIQTLPIYGEDAPDMDDIKRAIDNYKQMYG